MNARWFLNLRGLAVSRPARLFLSNSVALVVHGVEGILGLGINLWKI